LRNRIARIAEIPNVRADMTPWIADWAWSLPLILMTVSRSIDRRRLVPLFALVMGVAVLLVTALHAIEGMAWAGAYRFLGAVPDAKSAMLYSLNAMTTYGHESVSLAPQWQMMGALEALNGMLLFGLTTAFLFAMIQEVWPLAVRGGRRGG